MNHRTKDTLLSEMYALKVFGESKRQKKLFEYLLGETAAGNHEKISEFGVAIDVFERPENFDPTIDSIIRVEMYRLRNRLKLYSATSKKFTVEIPRSSWKVVITEKETSTEKDNEDETEEEIEPQKESKTEKINSRFIPSKTLSLIVVIGFIIVGTAVTTLSSNQLSTPETILIKTHVKVETHGSAVEENLARRLLGFMQSSLGGTRFVVQTPENIADIIFSFYIAPMQDGHEISLSVYSKDGKLISSNIYPYDSSTQSLFEVAQAIFEDHVGNSSHLSGRKELDCLLFIKVDTPEEAQESLDCLDESMPALDSDKVYFHTAKADVLSQVAARKHDLGIEDPLGLAAQELRKAKDLALHLPYYYHTIHLRTQYLSDNFHTAAFRDELETFYARYKENLEAKYLYAGYRFELFGEVEAAEEIEEYLDKHYPQKPLFIRQVAMEGRMFHRDWTEAKRHANFIEGLENRAYSFTTLACGTGDEDMQNEAIPLLRKRGIDTLEKFVAEVKAKSWHANYKKAILAMEVLKGCRVFTSNP